MNKLLIILLFPFICNAQSLPLKVGNFISQQQTNGFVMRGVDITQTLHIVLSNNFNCIDRGNTCTDLSANLTNAYPFIGTTLTSQKVNLITPASDAIVWTGSPTVNDGYMSFNGTTQYGAFFISGSALPTGTVAMTLSIFFQMPSNVDGMMLQIGENTGTATRFGIFYQAGNLVAEGSNVRASSAWTYNNSWHMVTISHPASGTPTTFKIYLDGSPMTIGSTTGSAAINIASTGEFAIAKISHSVSSLYTGNLKFPAIWGRQLSDAEVLQFFTTHKYLVGL